MKILKCLIVDDEPPAIRLLEKYVPFRINWYTTSSLEALLQLRKGMLIWFYGYSNARSNGFTIV
jgi:hypothetical protein